MKRWPINKAHFWERAPFFRALLPFAAGIMCYYKSWLIVPGAYALMIICIAFLLYLALLLARKASGIYSLATFVVLCTIMFFSGSAISYFNDIQHNKAWFGNSIDNDNVYLARITDAPVEKENSWKVPVSVASVIRDGKVTAATGHAFLYFYKDRFPMLLHKGDSILAPGKWQPISNAGNPFEFDYAAYCRQNNIYYQQSCSPNDVRLYAAARPAAYSAIEKCHSWCMAQLDKYITEPKTKGLIQAMLLGDEVNLDEELRQSYADAGIIHIIAISGGHVAVFFMIISALLWWLRDRKHLWVKYAIALPLVWFYVAMAGAPPSAVRAAIMFSLFALAVILQKNNNSLNQLFGTAFLLLCAQPQWLFSMGFQLSFVAVLSIILFYRPVYKWLAPVSRVARWLWSAVAISIAAEILVAPLVVYYFHNFPLLFIIANVVAYLFMSLVLILSIAIIAFSSVPVVATCIGRGMVWMVTVFDKVVGWLQSCNPASFHFLVLTTVELLLVYVVISGIVLFLMKRQKAALFTGLVACGLLFMSFCNDEWVRLHQQRLVVYNTGKANHIELIKGSAYAVLYTDTSAAKKTTYAVTPAHIGYRAWQQSSPGTNEIATIGSKTALVLNRDIDSGSFHVDYLVVNFTGTPDAIKLQRICSPKQIIIGNNYTRKQQDKFIKGCAVAGIVVHSMARNGAFVAN